MCFKILKSNSQCAVFYKRFAQTCLLRGFAAPVNNLAQSPLNRISQWAKVC